MKSELEIAKEKLRQYFLYLPIMIGSMEDQGASQKELEEATDRMLDLINTVRRQIKKMESKNS